MTKSDGTSGDGLEDVTSEVPQRADPEHPEGPKKDEKAPATGTRYSAHEIYENVRETAVEELERPVAALLNHGQVAAEKGAKTEEPHPSKGSNDL